MNLKEWQAMLPEEQQKYWNKASAADRVQIWDNPAFSIEKIKVETDFMEKTLGNRNKDVCTILDKESKEEQKAFYDYQANAEIARNTNDLETAKILSEIAGDEADHQMILTKRYGEICKEGAKMSESNSSNYDKAYKNALQVFDNDINEVTLIFKQIDKIFDAAVKCEYQELLDIYGDLSAGIGIKLNKSGYKIITNDLFNYIHSNAIENIMKNCGCK
jgi:rubrerythrin